VELVVVVEEEHVETGGDPEAVVRGCRDATIGGTGERADAGVEQRQLADLPGELDVT
jgi:hypothetical protein